MSSQVLRTESWRQRASAAWCICGRCRRRRRLPRSSCAGAHRAASIQRRRSTLLAASRSELFLIDVNPTLAFTQLVDWRATHDVAISARYAAAFDRQRRALRVWEAATGRELASLPAEELTKPVFDASGAFLAAKQQDAHGNDVAIRVWALPDWRELTKVPIKKSSSFALGPQGRLVAIQVFEPRADKRSHTCSVDVYELASGRRVARIPCGETVDGRSCDDSIPSRR